MEGDRGPQKLTPLASASLHFVNKMDKDPNSKILKQCIGGGVGPPTRPQLVQ